MRKKQFSFSSLFHSKILFIVSSVIFVLVVFALGKEFLRHYQINKDIVLLEEEVEELDIHNRELLELVQYFDTELFIEQEARNRLGLKKPGESVVVIPSEGENTQDKHLNIRGEYSNKDTPNFKKWWQYFLRD